MNLKSIVLSFGLLHSVVGAEAFAQTSTTWTVTGSWGAAGYARAGDFNADGKTDIASPYGADVYMKFSTGSGFTTATWVVDGGSTGWPGVADLLVGNFDCVNGADFVSVRQGNFSYIPVKFNNGASFTTSNWTISDIPFDVPAVYDLWGSQSFVRVGDFDGDGCQDDIISPGINGDTHHAVVFIGKRQPFGLGSDGFRYARAFTMHSTAGTPPWTLVGDFDQDGQDDYASASGSNIYMSFPGSLTLSGQVYHLNFTTATWPVSGSWGSTNYARASDPSSGGASSIYSPQGANVYVKTPHIPSSSFTASTATVANSWGGADWTFHGDFDGDGSKDDYASANGSNVYMKLF
jgi:hypothetical protein